MKGVALQVAGLWQPDGVDDVKQENHYYAAQAGHGPCTPLAVLHGEPVQGVTGMSTCQDMIYELHVALGTMLEALEQRHLAHNTLIICTSDNAGLMTPSSSNLTYMDPSVLSRGFRMEKHG
jgi:hypothetical protein